METKEQSPVLEQVKATTAECLIRSLTCSMSDVNQKVWAAKDIHELGKAMTDILNDTIADFQQICSSIIPTVIKKEKEQNLGIQ